MSDTVIMYSCNLAIKGMPGDLGIEWAADKVTAVAEVFQKLMDQGVRFFVVEKTGLVRKKTTVRVTASGDETAAAGRVVIPNEDIANVVNSGLAGLVKFDGINDIKQIRKAVSGVDAATNDTVAINQPGGG